MKDVNILYIPKGTQDEFILSQFKFYLRNVNEEGASRNLPVLREKSFYPLQQQAATASPFTRSFYSDKSTWKGRKLMTEIFCDGDQTVI